MELGELMRLVAKGEWKPYLIFTGPEISIMNIYLNKISELIGVPAKKVDSLRTIYSQINCRSVFNDKAMFVVRNDNDLIKQEKVWQDLPLYLGNNTLILVYSNIDKRSKFYKQNEQYIVEFDRLTKAQLSNYVMKELSLTTSNAEQLAEMCDCDYGRLMLEIDKLKYLRQALNDEVLDYNNSNTVEAPEMSDEDCFYHAMRSKLIYTAPKDVAFDFVGAVLRNDHSLSMGLLAELEELKTSEVMILSLLYTNFRNVLLVQGSNGTSEKTGLTGWQIQLAKDKLGYYSIQELVENLQIVRQVEKGIKTGKIDASISLEYCLAKCLKR